MMRSSNKAAFSSQLLREATRFVFALTICGAVFLSMGMQRGGDEEELKVVGVTSTGGYLFRVFEDGSIDFLSMTQDIRQQKTAGWTELPMDTSRQSNSKPPLPL